MEENKSENKSEVSFPLLHKLKYLDDKRLNYISKPSIIDKILEVTFLRFMPKFITPNALTIFRILTIPFVAFLLIQEYYASGTFLFVISAFSDALDGAMARTRHQVTDWGILFDPLADKLLIGTTAMIIVPKFVGLYVAIAIVFLELLIMVSAFYRFGAKVMPAKLAGKIKMILQSFSIGFLLLYVIVGTPMLLIVATYLIYGAIFFALVSLFVYRSI